MLIGALLQAVGMPDAVRSQAPSSQGLSQGLHQGNPYCSLGSLAPKVPLEKLGY